MLDINEINGTIKQLEDGETTFSNCNKLAVLYTVRDYMTGKSAAPELSNEVTEELSDILPCYKTYHEAKEKYRLREIAEQPVIVAMNQLCREIKEFMLSLYKGADTDDEKNQLKQMVKEVHGMM